METGNVYTLSIPKTNKEDSGDYTFSAENTLGVCSKDINVLVLEASMRSDYSASLE